MFRGSVFYFRFKMYLRLLHSRLVRIAVPAMAAFLIVAIIGSIFYLESSLALAATHETIDTIEVSPEESRPIENLITKTKPIPRSRLIKSTTNILTVSANKESLTMPASNIDIALPILMYHKTPSDFETQLQILQAKGYTAITMHSASRILRGLAPRPTKPVVITFDDGFSDQLTAFELLKRYNMPATFYVMTGGELSRWCVGADRRNEGCGDSYLNWTEIKMLSDSGLIEIGSHTIDHAQLNTLDSNTKREQITNAKAVIEQKIGKEVVSFAFPYGAFDAESIQLAKEAGYTSSVSTIGGIEQSTNILYELRRVRNGYDLP